MTAASNFVFYKTMSGHVMRALVVKAHRDGGVTVEPYFLQSPSGGDKPGGSFMGGFTLRLSAGHFASEAPAS